MGCTQSNARIAVEPNLPQVDNNEFQQKAMPASPVQTSPVPKAKNNQNARNSGNANVPTATLTKQPTTTNTMPWTNNSQNNQRNQNDEAKKKKKKNNKIVVTNKAIKNKSTSNNSNNNNNTKQKSTSLTNTKIVSSDTTTSHFLSSPLESTHPTSTETYSKNNDTTFIESELVLPTPTSSSNKIKLKPVKVKRRKRPRNDSNNKQQLPATLSPREENREQEERREKQEKEPQQTVQAESSITSVTSSITPNDLSPTSPILDLHPAKINNILTPTMDSPEPTPPPPSPPSPLVDIARQNDPRPYPSLEKVGPTTLGVQTSLNDSRFSQGIDGLAQRWGEVEFLLRIPIKNNNDIDVYHRTAYQSILLLQEIERMSRDLGM